MIIRVDFQLFNELSKESPSSKINEGRREITKKKYRSRKRGIRDVKD